jgi:colanic acid/amylovoran biosynthesis protein
MIPHAFQGALWAIIRRLFGINVTQLLNEGELRKFAEADIVVDVGYGDSLTDTYGKIQFVLTFYPLLFSVLLGKPFIIYPQSLGPFQSRLIRFLAKIVLNKAVSITAREEITRKYLRKIGVNRPAIYVTGDVAFVLGTAPYKRTEEILFKEGIREIGNPFIGMSISQFINLRYDNWRDNRYIMLMTRLVDYLTDKLGATVVLVPHVTAPGIVENDRVVGNLVLTKAKNKNKIIQLADEYTAKEYKGIIGQMDMFIGSRMHANIAAISMQVPTIAIGYSHKTSGIMNMVGLSEYVCDFRTITFDELISKVDKMWREREKIIKEMTPKIKNLQESVWLNGKLVKNLADSLGTPKTDRLSLGPRKRGFPRMKRAIKILTR